MTTKLDKSLKREIEVDGQLYTVTIAPEGVKVVPKGARNGTELDWRTIIRGGTQPRQDFGAPSAAGEG